MDGTSTGQGSDGVEFFKVGDLVWAKMKGFSPWPGQVTNPNKDIKKPVSKKHALYCIFFFGTNNYAWIEETNVKPYFEFKDQLIKTNKSGSFKDAIEAIEDYIKSSKGGKLIPMDPDAEFNKLKDAEKEDKEKRPSIKKEQLERGARKPSWSVKLTRGIDMSGNADTHYPAKQGVRKKRLVMSPKKRPPLSKNRPPKTNKKVNPSVQRSKTDDGASKIMKRTSSDTGNERMPVKRRKKRSSSMDDSMRQREGSPVANHSPSRRPPAVNLLDRPTNIPCLEAPSLDVESVTQTLKEKNIKASELKFGFLGLGIMGSGIVKNLLNSGHRVIVWNRTPEKCRDFVRAGAEQGQTPSDVISMADITFSCIADPATAKEIVFGNCGVVSEMSTDKGYVEMTSIDSETSIDISESIVAKGGRYLEAQIQGSKTQAEEGTLVILAAGDRSLFDSCQTCFKAMGKSSFFLGEVGNGSKMNLVLQLVAGVNLAGLAEGMALADRAGLQQKDVMEVLELTALACPMILEKGKAIVEGQFPTHQPLQHMQKDLKLSLMMGDQLEQPLPLTATTNELFKHAKRLGYGEHDASAVYIRARF
ncbi:cytokine-like nuclear factor N-PAC isoform X1 [Bacillus rossius redtenbacheri]|uniref:cytokine-like nuclear factor N-PAC isoform X1 n=1 Tax=Bacillus rossius redtenbacheri TaxID=93214 RepID=UPI002FDC8904